MMSRQRYEPVSQHEQNAIDLDALANGPYNYNTGLPNSVPSTAAPSYAAPSIRSGRTSPPPSFHSRAGTPRASMRGGEGAELWGVAPSTGGALTDRDTGICAGSEALETIRLLRDRVERLEESLGRLILEKEDLMTQGERPNHCCVSFTDASPDLENILARSGNQCCVSFTSSRTIAARGKKIKYAAMTAVMMTFFVVAALVILKSHDKVSKQRVLGSG